MKCFPLNVNSIMAFEHIRISTDGRPGTTENKSDVLEWVRLLLADGSTVVVIDDREPSFENALRSAVASRELVFESGPSQYIDRFGSSGKS